MQKHLLAGKIISSYKNDGYDKVRLNKNGIVKHFSVHRLVALAFIPNPNNLSEVGHKDESRNNNCTNNLEWITHIDNCNMPKYKDRISQDSKEKWAND